MRVEEVSWKNLLLFAFEKGMSGESDQYIEENEQVPRLQYVEILSKYINICSVLSSLTFLPLVDPPMRHLIYIFF